MGMQRIGSESDFPTNTARTNWGVLDEALMDHYLKSGPSSPSPFFHVIMTSTSHEPYDKAPVPDVFNARALPDHFRNTVHYTDSSIGKLVRGLKKWPGYDSTVVLILSDHGHQLPDWLHNHASERHRIPCILTGGALRNEYKGTIDSTYATHVDLPRTLLKQLDLDPDGFPWSRDIHAKDVTHFAFWTFNNGYGIADEDGELLYNHITRDTISTTYPSRILKNRWKAGNAYLQELMRAYKELDS
jgi:phosphoglycerol transferase MdoB-like AlkP superfamily enzyme